MDGAGAPGGVHHAVLGAQGDCVPLFPVLTRLASMPNPSHRYEFRSADVLRLLGGSLLPVVGFALAMHAGARWSWWPTPRPALDTERTVLLHQADAARDPGHADVVLV